MKYIDKASFPISVKLSVIWSHAQLVNSARVWRRLWTRQVIGYSVIVGRAQGDKGNTRICQTRDWPSGIGINAHGVHPYIYMTGPMNQPNIFCLARDRPY